MNVELVPAEEWHIDAIAADARAADIAELWTADRCTPAQAMRRALPVTVGARTGLVDGVPVCMFGAYPFSILGGMGTAWMIGSNGLCRISVQKALLRLSRPVVDEMRAMFPSLLWNFVDERNGQSIRWLRWLGFRFDNAMPYGEDGLPFLPFYIRSV